MKNSVPKTAPARQPQSLTSAQRHRKAGMARLYGRPVTLAEFMEWDRENHSCARATVQSALDCAALARQAGCALSAVEWENRDW